MTRIVSRAAGIATRGFEPGAALRGRGQREARAHCQHAARLALRALHAELVLYPKPGLVSLIDNGSHDDMDATTFLRSLFSLRHYFGAICRAGMDDAPFARLKQLGIAAEQRMLAATRGINTHRGAIFSVGLLCAAFGRLQTQAGTRTLPTPALLRAALLAGWGEALAGHTRTERVDTHGQVAAQLHAASGAREEGALGLPSVFEVGLPALQATLARGGCMQHARIDALFALMAHVSDTNVLHRGGAGGARMVRDASQAFLAMGGTRHPGWRGHALECHRLFVRHRLSPGGAADLLAASCLVHAFCAPVEK